MNKLLIGLLVVAAGTGAFLLFRKEKNESNSLHKEWIIGKWKLQSPEPVIDSGFQVYLYDFQKDGKLLQSLHDSVKADTFHYEWNKVNQLVWMEQKGDSSSMVFRVLSLTKDSLEIRGDDSVTVLFTKLN